MLFIWSDRSLNPEQKTSYNEKYVGEDAFYYLQLGFNTQFLGNYSFSMNNPNVNITVEHEEYFMILNNYSRENNIITLCFTSQNLNLSDGNFNKIFINIDNFPLSNFTEKEYDIVNVRRFIDSDDRILHIHKYNETLELSQNYKIANIIFQDFNLNDTQVGSNKIGLKISALINNNSINGVELFISENNEFNISLEKNDLSFIFDIIGSNLSITGVYKVLNDYYNFRYTLSSYLPQIESKFDMIASNGTFTFTIFNYSSDILNNLNKRIETELIIDNTPFEVTIEQSINNYFYIDDKNLYEFLLDKMFPDNDTKNDKNNYFIYLTLKTNFNQIINENFS